MKKRKMTPCKECVIRPLAAFRGVPKKALDKMQKMRVTIKLLEKGDHLCQPGDKDPLCYTLACGLAILYTIDKNGTLRVLRVLFPGEFINFNPNGDGTTVNGIKILVDETKFCCFERENLKAHMGADLYKTVCEKYSETIAYHHNLHHILPDKLKIAIVLNHAHEKVAQILKHRPDNPVFGDGYIPIPAKDLSALAGTSIDTYHKAMTDLKSQGIIEFSAKANEKFKILDPDALREMIEKGKEV